MRHQSSGNDLTQVFLPVRSQNEWERTFFTCIFYWNGVYSLKSVAPKIKKNKTKSP
jgi:hypothetical protein